MPYIRLGVTVRAGAKHALVDKLGENTYRVHTPTAPEKGKANEAVIELLAKHLGIKKSLITLERGETSKKKVFRLEI